MVTAEQSNTENPIEPVAQEPQAPLPQEDNRLPEDVDWKAKYEADVAAKDDQIAKLESDSKANANRLRKVREETTELGDLRTRLDDLTVEMSSLPDIISAVVEHGTDSEGLKARVSEVQQSSRSKREEQLFTTRHDQTVRRTEDILADVEDKKAEDIRSRWRLAVDQQLKLPVSERTTSVFDDLYLEAREASLEKAIAQKDEEIAKRDRELDEAKKKFEADYDVHSVDTGATSGPASGASLEALRQVDKIKMNMDELQAHKEAVLKAIARQ